jgi:hypothetical protein
MTGRGAGFCGGYSAPGYASSPGRGGYSGSGRGVRGGGRGLRNQHCSNFMGYRGRGFQNYPPYYGRGFSYSQPEFSADLEIKVLKEQAEFMQKEASLINERIRELESLAAGQKDQT